MGLNQERLWLQTARGTQILELQEGLFTSASVLDLATESCAGRFPHPTRHCGALRSEGGADPLLEGAGKAPGFPNTAWGRPFRSLITFLL